MYKNKTPAPRMNHLQPIPWEAQEAQSEWLLEQFDAQLAPVPHGLDEPNWNYQYTLTRDGGTCPQIWVEVPYQGPYYKVPLFKHPGEDVELLTVIRRPIIELKVGEAEEDDDGRYIELFVEWSDSAARWPMPLIGDHLEDNLSVSQMFHDLARCLYE